MNTADPSSQHVHTARIPGSNRAAGEQETPGQSSGGRTSGGPSQAQVTAALKRVRAVAWLMDNAVSIPGTRIKFGLDPLVGLIPGAGDLITTIISAYTVVEAKRLNMPASVTQRMVGNIALDFFAGLVPALGDAIDVLIRANDRNLKLLEQALRDAGYDV